MSLHSVTISTKRPAFPDMDYALLREKALEHIQRLSGKVWTDHNTHDPGITTIELLAYAITDLGYRTEYAIADILAPSDNAPPQDTPSFYTAAQALSCNPTTINDFRKMVMDVTGVKNAWLEPVREPIGDIHVKGIYDVMIELEEDDRWGDLNKRILKLPMKYGDFEMQVEIAIINELNWNDFDHIEHIKINDRKKDLFRYGDYRYAHQANLSLGAKRTDGSHFETQLQVRIGLLGDNSPNHFIIPKLGIGEYIIADEKETRHRLDDNWFMFVYSEDEPIPFEDDEINLIYDTYRDAMIDLITGKNFLNTLNLEYLPKQVHIASIINDIKERLFLSRNLCEDFNEIKIVDIQELALDAKFELAPEADPENVLAEVYYCIGEFLSPSIRRYTIDELQEKGKTIAEIFEGPLLYNGFVDDDELKKIQKRSVIYTSQLLSLIMDVPGIRAVRSLTLSHYIHGLLNLENQADYVRLVNPSLYLPRISADKSKIKIYKYDLEDIFNDKVVLDELENLKRQRRLSKIYNCVNDLPIPKGTFKNIATYYSIQNDFPPIYGIGEDGLSDTSSPERKAKAKQFKAYLIFAEQLLANYLSQLAHLNDLFSFSANHEPQTYYYQSLNTVPDLKNMGIIEGWDKESENYDDSLAADNESPALFLDRKNRFLDHLMGRFAERFDEYAALMHIINSEKMADINHLVDSIEPDDFAQLMKQYIIGIERSLKDMIQRAIKVEIKESIVSMMRKYGADPKTAAAIKEAIQEGLKPTLEKQVESSFKQAIKNGFEEGKQDVVLEISQDLVKRAGNDDAKLDQVATDVDVLREAIEKLYEYRAESIIDELLKEVFQKSIHDATFESVEKIASEVANEIISGIQLGKAPRETPKDIENIVKNIIVRNVGAKVKKASTDAIKSLVRSAREKAIKQASFKTHSDLVYAKINFLQQHPEVSSKRGQSFSYLDKHKVLLQTEFVSGFHKRICSLMGLSGYYPNPRFVRAPINARQIADADGTQKIPEGFYVVEHLLLRPKPNKRSDAQEIAQEMKNLLGIGEKEYDVYSFQMSIVVPLQVGRFTNQHFRTLFERIVQSEAPSHLLIYIHWLEASTMERFEKLYTHWLMSH